MRYFPHIPRTVRTGTYSSTTHPSRSSRCPELASSYCLCHYRPTSACFCHRLYTSARRLPAVPASQPASLPAACSACSACSARSARSACSARSARRLPVTCLLCRSSPPACKKKRDFPKSRFFIIRFGPSSAPPRLSARQSRKPSRTSCSRILAQSATGCFSPSTNRSGHPRLQSSM